MLVHHIVVNEIGRDWRFVQNMVEVGGENQSTNDSPPQNYRTHKVWIDWKGHYERENIIHLTM